MFGIFKKKKSKEKNPKKQAYLSCANCMFFGNYYIDHGIEPVPDTAFCRDSIGETVHKDPCCEAFRYERRFRDTEYENYEWVRNPKK